MAIGTLPEPAVVTGSDSAFGHDHAGPRWRRP